MQSMIEQFELIKARATEILPMFFPESIDDFSQYIRTWRGWLGIRILSIAYLDGNELQGSAMPRTRYREPITS